MDRAMCEKNNRAAALALSLVRRQSYLTIMEMDEKYPKRV